VHDDADGPHVRASFVEASEGDDFDDLAFHHTDEAGQARRAGGQAGAPGFDRNIGQVQRTPDRQRLVLELSQVGRVLGLQRADEDVRWGHGSPPT